MNYILRDKIIDSMYNSLPKIFRDEDLKQDLFLRKLLEVIVYGGFMPYIDDVQKLYHKYDSSQWSEKDIQKFAKDFGWEFDKRLDIEYQRRLVDHMMELLKIRGTKPCINYVANDMTGYDCTIIENYEGNPEEVGIKLHAQEDDDIPNFYTRSSIGFFLPFYCVPLLIIYYNFFLTTPLEFYGHESKNTIYYTPTSNPWSLNIVKSAFYNGEYKYDGMISYAGGIGGDGPLHQHTINIHKDIIAHIGSNEVIVSNIYDGYFRYNGEILYDNKLLKKDVICIHEHLYGILKNIVTNPVDVQHGDIEIKEYNVYYYNGKIKYDGKCDYSGALLKQSFTK